MKPTASSLKIRRRNRIITSCLECRRRKLKCDKLHPCTNCTKFSRDCVFLAPTLDSASQGRLNEFKEKIDSLEQDLENDAAGGLRFPLANGLNAYGSSTKGFADGADEAGQLNVPDDEKNLEPSPLSVEDAAFDDETDDIMDLGIQLGRMRISERLGGWVRPKISTEIVDLRRYSDLKYYGELVDSSETPLIPAFDVNNLPAWLQPSSEYISPETDILFATGSANPDTAFINFLPARDVADKLLHRYWKFCHPIVCCVHRPSFERQYESFWADVMAGFEPPNSLQAVVFAALFTASVSISEKAAQTTFGLEKSKMVENFRIGCECALARAHLLRTTKTETLQAFVMYLIPLCRGEVSRSHAALTSAAIRLAECAGFHRDGINYNLSPVAAHVRRLIWHQLSILDIRTCEAVGPKPQIRAGDADTQFPVHCDEEELESLVPPTKDVDRWTDTMPSRIRFEIADLQHELWLERRRVLTKRISLTTMLSKVETLRERLEKLFLKHIDETEPLQHWTSRMARLHIARMHVFLLSNTIVPGSRGCPDRLRQVVLSSGTLSLEYGVELETKPEFAPWFWFARALHQFHAATLLLMEINIYPMRREADRIWACLDYIFDIPLHLSRDDKAKVVLSEWRTRMDIYNSLRKQRTPAELEQRLRGSTTSISQDSNKRGSITRQFSTDSNGSGEVSQSFANAPLYKHADETSSAAQRHANTWKEATSRTNPTNQPQPEHFAFNVAQYPNFPSSYSSPSVDNVSSRGSGSVSGRELNMDIDWTEWDRIFPPDINTGDLNMPQYATTPPAVTSQPMPNFVEANTNVDFNLPPMNYYGGDSNVQQRTRSDGGTPR